MQTLVRGFPGFLVVVLIAAAALIAAEYLSLSAILIAILLGFVVGNLIRLPAKHQVGIKWAESYGLALAVALLGVQLNLAVLMQINPINLSLIAAAILLTFLVTFMLAKFLRVSRTEACLLASGQAICGSAAVMAVSQSIRVPNTAQTGLVIAVINFLGFLGVFITPWLIQTFFHQQEVASGFLIGNTLQSMGHVVAAGFSVSDEVGHGAVLFKMCRILFLIPTLLVLVFYFNRSVNQPLISTNDSRVNTSVFVWLKWVPLFIWGFLALLVLNNLGWITQGVELRLTQLGDGLFVLAMAAIGLSIRLTDLWQQGSKLLLLGGTVFVLQIGFSLLVAAYI